MAKSHSLIDEELGRIVSNLPATCLAENEARRKRVEASQTHR